MDNPLISRPIAKHHLHIIPEYTGNPIELLSFLEVVEKLKNDYCNNRIAEAADNHWILLHYCKNKLHGPAKDVILNSTVDDLSNLIDVLKNNFADNRTVEQLTMELLAMKSHQKEHPIQFINRLQQKRTVIISRHKLDGLTGPILETISSQLDKQIVMILVEGINHQLGAHLQTLGIKDLSDARQAIINKSSAYLKHLGFTTDVTQMNQTFSKSEGKQNSSNSNQNSHPKNFHQFQNQNNSNQRNFSQSQNRNFNFNQRNFSQPQNHFNQRNFSQPQNNFNRGQSFQSRFRNGQSFQNHNFNRNPNANFNNNNQNLNQKSNDVSMRTVSNFQKFPVHNIESSENEFSEFESMNARMSSMENAVSDLCEKMNHFLEVGSNNNPKT
ncbi:putative uncharacterized protein DDB_G0286901 [Nilaparvata lugens]|uniref:putative uncharacterized protein DDB_G0286901 n=1 Tax=Nilaparvata lugens TaxID=108931 RepID=UPI00193CBA93|nr:putative uncharacterized protein DDB_G0286901 [Nilaparvata lugens]